MEDYPEGIGKDVRFLIRNSAQAGVAVQLSLALPTWESFAAVDRQHLVSAIVQAARRQVQARPIGQGRATQAAAR
jgi:hypothetical protein